MLLVSVAFSANAQEGVPNNEIPDLNFHQEVLEERPLLYEPTTSSEKTMQNKEQLANGVRSGKTIKPVEDPKNPANKPAEEDALSFNFLYYIIQKFKISDIVEQ